MVPQLSTTANNDKRYTVKVSTCLTGERKNVTDTKIITAIKFADEFFNDRAMNTVAGIGFVLGARGTSVLTLMGLVVLLQFRGQHIKMITHHMDIWVLGFGAPY